MAVARMFLTLYIIFISDFNLGISKQETLIPSAKIAIFLQMRRVIA